MKIPEQLRAFLERFAKIQGRPITDAALVERMRTEATTWINAVHMQHQRVTHPAVLENSPGDEIWRQEIDLHFLLVALTRLHRAVGLAAKVPALQDQLLGHLAAFDEAAPALRTLRNVAEHFDDYTTGRGRNADIKRFQLQTWSLGEHADGGLVWSWLGVELPVEAVDDAAASLYRRFLADVNEYMASNGSDQNS